MRALRTVLVAIGVLCVLSALPGVVAPWSSIVRWFGLLGYHALPGYPLVEYALRVASVGFVLIGIFFLVLASDPTRYRPMLALGEWGLVVLGAAALAAGWLIPLRPPWYLADAGACLLAAVVILALWPRHTAHPA